MYSRNRHNNFMMKGAQLAQTFSRKLVGDLNVMIMNALKYPHQQWNQQDDNPCAMDKLRDDEDQQDDERSNRTDAVYHEIFSPMRWPCFGPAWITGRNCGS